MDEFFDQLFDTSDFPARWHCGNWTSAHGWLHIGSDIAVFAAYITIPIVLIYFILRRRDLPFPRIFWMFVAFIAFCGFNHLAEAYIFWTPIYRVSGLLKVATAIASWATVWSLIRLMPIAIELRSPVELEEQVVERTKQLEDNRAELHRLNTELRAANADLRHYAHIVSHDLRSPLRAIKSLVHILDERLGASLEQTDRESMDHVKGGIERMEAMTRDLLEYSRTDREDIVQVEVDLDAVLNTLVTENRLGRDDADLAIEIGSLPRVHGDEVKLRQLFQNLLDNAIKFCGPRPPRIRVVGRETDDAWEIDVADEGIGFEARHSDRIFEPFQRLHLPEEYEGTGIGLSIVHKIVRQHGGTIAVRSSPGQGACFTVSLPRPREDVGKVTRIVLSTLVIDDDLTDLMLAELTLRETGRYRDVDRARTGERALARLTEMLEDPGREEHWQLVLLDINMPGMSGFELLDQLHDRLARVQPPPAMPPIVMLSSSTSPEDRARAEASPLVEGYLVKPLGIEDAVELAERFGRPSRGAPGRSTPSE